MSKMSADLLKKVEEGRQTGELSMRFEGHRAGEAVPDCSMDVWAKRVPEGWDFRIMLGNGKRWRNTVPEDKYEFTVECLYEMFAQLGKEIPRA